MHPNMERILKALIATLAAMAIVMPAAAQEPAAAQNQNDPSGELPAPKTGRQLLAPPRLWTTVDGKFEVLAGLLEIEAEKVVLKRSDNGYIARVAFDQLSQADIDYIRNFKPADSKMNAEPEFVPELPPPSLPQSELKASKPENRRFDTSQSDVDTGFRRSVGIVGAAIEKQEGDLLDGTQTLNPGRAPGSYRRFAESLEDHITVAHRAGIGDLSGSLQFDPLPMDDIALTVPKHEEIRLKPPVSSPESLAAEASDRSNPPSLAAADTRPSVVKKDEPVLEAGVDISVVADLVRDSRISLDPTLVVAGKGILIRFQLSGRDANHAFRAGELVLSDLLDNKGLPLGIRGTQPSRNGLNGAWTLVDASTRSCSVELTIPEGRDFEGVGRLKGSFKVDLVTTLKTCSLPVTGESAEAIALKNDHGISIFIRKDNRSIVVETSGNVLDVARLGLDGVDSAKVTPSSDIRRRTGWYQFDCSEDFPPDVQVNIKVVTGVRQITVPVDFGNVAFSDPDEYLPR